MRFIRTCGRRGTGRRRRRQVLTDLSRALDIAVAAARAAGEILRRDFHRRGGPRGQHDKAEADIEAEAEIRGRLLAAFPAWGYLGEETGRATGEPGAPIWLVDPNDGTRDYLVGRRGSSVSIGLVAGRPVLGVVFAFAYPGGEGDLFAWAEGCGSLRRNGSAVEAKLPTMLTPLDVVLVSSKGDREPEANLRCVAPCRYRAVPSIAHRLGLVAAGEAAVATSLYAPGAWDYAAGQALLRAAAGVLVDESGVEVQYGKDGASSTLRAFGGSPSVAREMARRPWEVVRRDTPGRPDGPARLRRGEAAADPALLSRAQGCLLGQVAGDSLGGLVECETAAEIAARFPDGPRRLDDGGRWGTLAGQPTDDSEMFLALARSVVEAGRYDAEAALRAYREWYRSEPFDVGQTTRAALVGYLMAESQANGSLTRASPLGVLAHSMSADRAAALGREDSALTHPNPVCRDAVAAFVVAVARAIARGEAEDAYRAASAWACETAARPVVETLAAAATAPPVCDGPNPGSVLIALQNAFYELLHAPSLEEGIVATVRRGGDSHTNAAIAGALLGAAGGRAAVPAQWQQMILSCRPHPLRAKHPRPRAYWPVDIFEVAELLLLAGGAAVNPPLAAAP